MVANKAKKVSPSFEDIIAATGGSRQLHWQLDRTIGELETNQQATAENSQSLVKHTEDTLHDLRSISESISKLHETITTVASIARERRLQ